MIKHLVFYALETTLITGMMWVGLWFAVRALRRMGVPVRLKLVVPVLGWLVIAAIDTVMSEWLGPEFTLLYHFGIWTLVGGFGLWLITTVRFGLTAIRARAGSRMASPAENP